MFEKVGHLRSFLTKKAFTSSTKNTKFIKEKYLPYVYYYHILYFYMWKTHKKYTKVSFTFLANEYKRRHHHQLMLHCINGHIHVQSDFFRIGLVVSHHLMLLRIRGKRVSLWTVTSHHKISFCCRLLREGISAATITS